MSIENDIERGIKIREQLDTLKKELAAIEERIETAGLARPEEHVELVDAEREGRQWLARGSEHVVPVIFTADKLIARFRANTATHQTIRVSLGRYAGKLVDFYEAQTTFENRFDVGKKFRLAAQQILGDHAPPFVTACVSRDKHGTPKSDIKILWGEAQEI